MHGVKVKITGVYYIELWARIFTSHTPRYSCRPVEILYFRIGVVL